MRDVARRMCGECKYFMPDKKRTSYDVVNRCGEIRSVLWHMGDCAKHKTRVERCQWVDGCEAFTLDSKKSMNGLAKAEPDSTGHGPPVRIECVTTGRIFDSIKSAAKSVNRSPSTLATSIRYSLSKDGCVLCGGMKFRVAKEGKR